MTPPTFDAEAHLDHMSEILGLSIDPTWRAGVVGHVATVARMAALVEALPLDDHVEPAFVFEADR
ncbi:MAG TPA: DUF4089 domain-containing protein [Methylomirabilota bacterium]|nr:DUF4089 domain-containing protein [Methylomirabilota bacterium]